MYLGIDLGTSGIKAMLIDDRQQVVASGHGALSVSRPHPGWSEQNPAEWIKACQEAIAELKASHPGALAAVKGIGLSGQMHGATLIDASDEVLGPCILWNDTRSFKQAADLDSDPRFRAISGNIVFPGFTAPKLVWVRENQPDVFKRIAKVLLPKDFLRLWLSGEHISEMSDAAGTSWLDVGKRGWSDELLSAGGMTRDQMPDLVEGTQKAGQLRTELAAQWSMGSGVVIAGGAGDNAASAVGMGAVRDGQGFVSLGTSGVLFAANDSYLPNPESAVHAFCHCLPDAWHQMAVILSASDSMNWLAGITGLSASELTGELGDELKVPGSVTFLPYLSGERTPHNDAAIRGAFTGLGHESGRAALTQAVLEGVTFAIRDGLEALISAGANLPRLTAIGGGSRSRYWLKSIATALGIPVDLPAAGDFGAAFGAARLGLIAAENADPLTVCTPPPTSETIDPQSDLAEAFDNAYTRYRALYPAIKHKK